MFSNVIMHVIHIFLYMIIYVEYNIYVYMYIKIYLFNMQIDNISFSDILSLLVKKLNPFFSNSGYLFYKYDRFSHFRTRRILDVRIRR